MKTWKEIKEGGSSHYKNSDQVEPIDLYLASGALRHFALCSIIKYAYRNLNTEEPVRKSDMIKIRHYSEMLETAYTGG
jgi:hypothetical protein